MILTIIMIMIIIFNRFGKAPVAINIHNVLRDYLSLVPRAGNPSILYPFTTLAENTIKREKEVRSVALALAVVSVLIFFWISPVSWPVLLCLFSKPAKWRRFSPGRRSSRSACTASRSWIFSPSGTSWRKRAFSSTRRTFSLSSSPRRRRRRTRTRRTRPRRRGSLSWIKIPS